MGKIIAISTPKGGVGKTTTAINLALALSDKKKRTLLIDLDPSGQCASSLGFMPNNINGDILDVFRFSKSFKSVIHKTENEDLDFVPMKSLDYANEKKLTNLISQEFLFKDILSSEIYSYNYIIIDSPPNLSGTTTNVLLAADSVLIPVRSSQHSVNEVNRFIDHIDLIKEKYNSSLQIEGLLLTMYESKTKASFLAKKLILEKYPNHVLNLVIPKNVEVSEASFYNKPILRFNPNAKSSIAYKNLAEELINRHSTPVLS